MSVDADGPPELMLGRAGRRPRARVSRPAQHGGEPSLLVAAGFLALLRSGGVPEVGRAELLRGKVTSLPTLRPAHAATVLSLHGRLAAALERWAATASVEAPYTPPAEALRRPLVGLGPEDLLRPEIAVLARPARRLAGPGSFATPRERVLAGGSLGAEGLVLAVELAGDGGRGSGQQQAAITLRLSAYARAGVREVWLLELGRGWTEAYRAPWAGAFRSRTLWYPGEEVPLGSLGLAVEALELG